MENSVLCEWGLKTETFSLSQSIFASAKLSDCSSDRTIIFLSEMFKIALIANKVQIKWEISALGEEKKQQDASISYHFLYKCNWDLNRWDCTKGTSFKQGSCFLRSSLRKGLVCLHSWNKYMKCSDNYLPSFPSHEDILQHQVTFET